MMHRTLISIVCALVMCHVGVGRGDGRQDEIARLRAETFKHPDSTGRWVELSRACVELARADDDFHWYELAESAAVTAWDLDTTNVAALMQLAVVYAGNKRFPLSARYLDKAIVERLFNAEAWGLLGDSYMATGRYRAADSCYAIAWEIDPGFDTLLRLARRAVDIDTLEEAIELAGRAVQAGKDSLYPPQRLAIAYRQSAHIHLLAGQWNEAGRLLDRALELEADVPTMIVKADLLAWKGEVERAIEIYDEVVGRSPAPRHRLALARLHGQSKQRGMADSLLTAARDGYESLAARYPRVFDADLAAFYLDTGTNAEDALRLARRESRRRKDVHTYDLLAWAYHKNKKYNLAWSSISFALRKGTMHPRIVYHAAVIAKAAGKMDRYQHYADETRRLNPRFEKMFGPL